MDSKALHRRCGLLNTSQLTGKRLLFIGHPDPRKTVWEIASELGVECHLIGPAPKTPLPEQVASYISYDLTNHADDDTHCDVMTELVTSKLGDVDGCLTVWDDCIPLTALVCRRLQKVGLHPWGAMAAQQKGLTFQALRNSALTSKETVGDSKFNSPDAHSSKKNGLIIGDAIDAVSEGLKENSLSASNSNEKETRMTRKGDDGNLRREENKLSDNVADVDRDDSNRGQEGNKLSGHVDEKNRDDSKLRQGGNELNGKVEDKRLQSQITKESLSINIDAAKYTSRCLSLTSQQDVERGALSVGFPAVMKMEYGAAGRGIKVVDTVEECRQHFSYLQQLCADTDDDVYKITMGMGFKTHCVLTEFLQGSEHCVDLVAFHGQLLLAVVTDKGPQCLPDTFHTVTIMPSLLGPDTQSDVIQAAWDCCQALGLRHGVFDVDIMLTSTGPKLIEINARLGGYCQRDFARHCFDVDFFHLACMVACDIKPHFSECFFPQIKKILPISDANYASVTNGHHKSRCEQVSLTRKSLDASHCNDADATVLTNDESLEITIKTNGNHCNGTPGKDPVISNGPSVDRTSFSALKTIVSTEERTSGGKKQASTALAFPVPAAKYFVVGLMLYPRKHGAAFNTSSSVLTVQRLHEEGELLYPFPEMALAEKDDELPFYTLAVKRRSFSEARGRLEELCEDLGIHAPELSSVHYDCGPGAQRVHT